MRCTLCGEEISDSTPSGLCHKCYDRQYSAARRKAKKAAAKAKKPRLLDSILPDAVRSAEKAQTAVEKTREAFFATSPSLAGLPHTVEPIAPGVPCILRNPDTGQYIDLVTGRVTDSYEAFCTADERELLAQK